MLIKRLAERGKLIDIFAGLLDDLLAGLLDDLLAGVPDDFLVDVLVGVLFGNLDVVWWSGQCRSGRGGALSC